MNLDFVLRAVSGIWEIMNRNFSFKSYLTDDSGLNKQFLKFKPWQVENFFKIIDEDLVQFFKSDKCCRVADNYLIAMVFVYFIRADFKVEEYTSLYFIAALHLALDMEEDDDHLQSHLQKWFKANTGTLFILLEKRDRVFQRIGYRGAISRRSCESVMRRINPNHSVWRRLRHINHSGAISGYSSKRNMCPRCL